MAEVGNRGWTQIRADRKIDSGSENRKVTKGTKGYKELKNKAALVQVG